MTGEKIYEYDLDVSGMTDFGVSLAAVLASKEKVPPQGARIGMAFEARASGRLLGQVCGFDYLQIRTDGRIDLDIRATLETDDGCRIALSANGVAVSHPGEPIAELRENVSLTTAASGYAWVNARQTWGVGTVNFATGKIHVDAYLQ